MSGYIREISVILLDISRSMFRRDFSPSRWSIAKKAIILFLEEKRRIDASDKNAVVSISESPQILLNFEENITDFLKNWPTTSISLTNSPPPSYTSWEKTLKYAIDLFGDQIRMIGGQVYRILIITDKSRIPLSPQLFELCKMASGLNIFIDLCVLIQSKTPLSLDSFESITKETKGELGYFHNPKAFIRGVQGFASKKIIEENSAKLLNNREKDDAKYLAEMASYLRFPTAEEINTMKNRPKDQTKCQICFSYFTSPEKVPFSKTGRYCPHCGMLMHLQCASLWAQKTEVAPNLFRCPHCYTLLKLDPPLLKGLEFLQTDKIQAKTNSGDFKKRTVKMVKVNDLNLNDQTICYFCFQSLSIIPVQKVTPEIANSKSDPNVVTSNKIFRCSSCSANFHEKCLEIMYKDRKCCTNCGGFIS